MNSTVFVLSSLLMSQGRGQGTEGLCCLVTGDLIFAALSSQTHYPVSNDVPMKVLLDPFCIHFFTHWYSIALFLNKRSISRSLASAFIVHATESYSFCLCGRGNKSKDALLFTDLFLVFQLLPLFSPAWWLVTSLFTRDFLSISLCSCNFFLCIVLGCKLCSALSYHDSFPVGISYSNLCL